MKAVAISTLAFVATVNAGWQDVPAEPVKSKTTEKPVDITSTWEDQPIISTTTTAPVKEATQSYWGDEDVKTTTTTPEYPSETEDHTWSDEPVIETVTTVVEHTWKDEPVIETVTTVIDHTWSDYVAPTPTPESPVEGGEHTWSDVEVPAGKTSTTVVTGTVTETKWVDVSPATPVSPAEPSTWADYVASTPAADKCTVTIVTKYGKPTWYPDNAASTWADVAIPATTPVAGETPGTWVDVAIPSTTPVAGETPATWADAPAPTEPVSGDEGKPWEDVPSDCSASTVTEEVTITYTVTADHTWADVELTSTTPAVGVETKTWVDYTVPSDEPEKPVHGGKGKPSKPAVPATTTTTTPAVETKTWADYTVSTTVPAEETESSTWADYTLSTTTTKPSKPSKPTTTTSEVPSEETQAYWGDAQ